MSVTDRPRRGFEGIYFILSTPFTPDWEIDIRSVRTLVEAVLTAGVDGITVLGVAGEAQKLSLAEREAVTTQVVEIVGGRVPVIVGVSHDGTDLTRSAAAAAERAGAAGLLLAPPTFAQAGRSLSDHFRSVAESSALPIVLQDYPPVNAVNLSPRAMADLVEDNPSVVSIKLEGVPTPLRVGQTLKLVPPGVTILGGLGGTYFLDELRHGARGTMTGFAYPEILVDMWSDWENARATAAADLYRRYLPILILESQAGISLSIRKELLRRRGWIAHAVVRRPSPELDSLTLRDIEATCSYLELGQSYVRN